MKSSPPEEGIPLELVHEGDPGSSPQPTARFMREPNRAERRWALRHNGNRSLGHSQGPTTMFRRISHQVTKISADPHRWVEPVKEKPKKKTRAKKTVNQD